MPVQQRYQSWPWRKSKKSFIRVQCFGIRDLQFIPTDCFLLHVLTEFAISVLGVDRQEATNYGSSDRLCNNHRSCLLRPGRLFWLCNLRPQLRCWRNHAKREHPGGTLWGKRMDSGLVIFAPCRCNPSQSALSDACQRHYWGTIPWPRSHDEQEVELYSDTDYHNYLLSGCSVHSKYFRCYDSNWSHIQSSCRLHPAGRLLPQNGWA